MLILGIDPGLNGAFALLDDGRLVNVDDLPTMGVGAKRQLNGGALADALRSRGVGLAVVEQVGSMPGQGIASTFRFGLAVGQILGVLQGLDIPIIRAAPVSWKRSFNLGSDKEHSRATAINLFPAQRGRFARKLDHGRAEAALIALWGHRTRYTTATADRGAGAGAASASPVSNTE